MKIYLAGKISKNCWRHDVVTGLRDAFSIEGLARGDEFSWPVMEKAIFGLHDYTGPYFVSCNHGCYHGVDSHGMAVDRVGGHCLGCWPKRGTTEQGVVGACLSAIERSDLVFCWFESRDIYGSLFEIGYAAGLGKTVVGSNPYSADDADSDDSVCCDCQSLGKHGPCESCAETLDWQGYPRDDLWFSRAAITSYVRPTAAEIKAKCGWTPADALKRHLGIWDHSWVYFIEAVGLERIKIGKANNPEARLAGLQTGSPVPLRLLGKIPGGHALEKKLHGEFASLWMDGEWFHATKELRNYIHATCKVESCLK